MRRYSLIVADQTDDLIKIKMAESNSGEYTDFFEAYNTISSLHEQIEDLSEEIKKLNKEIEMLDSLYGGRE
jgi:peptidoglycan hydrolase CwlO-like protein